MMVDDLFAGMEHEPEDEVRIKRAPFGYVGNKRSSAKHILPMLPYRKRYIEVFGGSGVILLNRRPSEIDVYNDRFGGVVCFYRCLKDPIKYAAMCEWLKVCVNAKEEYAWCRETWRDCTDDVERACRWYYSMHYSFGSKGGNWGRTVGTSPTSAPSNKFPLFETAHQRLRSVQIENASWRKILTDYDSDESVFYLDPPYVATDSGGYKYSMSPDDHREMLDFIQDMEGFVALSGFTNSLYDGYDWDDRITWEVTCPLTGNANNEGNNKAHMAGLECSAKAEEVLWIKE